MTTNLINPSKLFIMTARSAEVLHSDVDKIISILDPNSYYKTCFANTDKSKVLFFEDEEELSNKYQLPNLMHIHSVLEFVDNIKPNETVIIHCEAGRSRSTAMAIGCLIYSGLSVKEAVDKVFEIRPKAIPNNLILRLFEHELNLKECELISCVNSQFKKNDFHFNWDFKKSQEFKDDNDDLDLYLTYKEKIILEKNIVNKSNSVGKSSINPKKLKKTNKIKHKKEINFDFNR